MPRATFHAARNSSRRQRFLTSQITHRPSFSRRWKTSRADTSDPCGSILPKKSRRPLHESKRSGGRTPNQECSQPPPYFVVAAAWFHIGQWIGIKDGSTLYWVRFLNVAFTTALVWLAYVAARMIFPQQVALRLGVPLLIAAVPQDTFYGINNDVLSPICFGLV